MDYDTLAAALIPMCGAIVLAWVRARSMERRWALQNEKDPSVMVLAKQAFIRSKNAEDIAKQNNSTSGVTQVLATKLEEFKRDIFAQLDQRIDQRVTIALDVHLQKLRLDLEQYKTSLDRRSSIPIPELQDRADRWGQALRAEFSQFGAQVRTEIERVANEAVRRALVDVEKKVNDMDKEMDEIDQELQRTFGYLEGSGTLTRPGSATTIRRRRKV